MNRIVFLLEEDSLRILLEGLLPRLFPELSFPQTDVTPCPDTGRESSPEGRRMAISGKTNHPISKRHTQ